MQEFKDQLITHIKGGAAFMPIEELLKFISSKALFTRPLDLPYSFYEIFYHMRFAQKDILDYIRDEDYKTHRWPEDYWPDNNGIDSVADWEVLKTNFFKEQQELINFIKDPYNDLLKPINPETEHNLLREVLLVIEHNAYHSGQLLIVLRSLKLYPA